MEHNTYYRGECGLIHSQISSPSVMGPKLKLIKINLNFLLFRTVNKEVPIHKTRFLNTNNILLCNFTKSVHGSRTTQCEK